MCTPQLLSEEEFDLDVKSSIMEDACHYDCNQVEYEAEISVGDLDVTPALLFYNETVTYRCAFIVSFLLINNCSPGTPLPTTDVYRSVR